MLKWVLNRLRSLFVTEGEIYALRERYDQIWDEYSRLKPSRLEVEKASLIKSVISVVPPVRYFLKIYYPLYSIYRDDCGEDYKFETKKEERDALKKFISEWEKDKEKKHVLALGIEYKINGKRWVNTEEIFNFVDIPNETFKLIIEKIHKENIRELKDHSI